MLFRFITFLLEYTRRAGWPSGPRIQSFFRTLFDHGCSQVNSETAKRCSKTESSTSFFDHFLVTDVPNSKPKLQKGVPKQGPEGSI